MSGNGGVDVFVFEQGHGIDRIFDFEPDIDFLEFQGDSLSFEDISVNDFKGTASVSMGQGDTALLQGIAPEQVEEAWFIFA